MSELLYIESLKANAEQAANAGKTIDANPHKTDLRRSEVWLTYFYAQLERNEQARAA